MQDYFVFVLVMQLSNFRLYSNEFCEMHMVLYFQLI